MNQLTKDAIARALTDLLQERPIDKITIKDITDRCGINRQTFYYHFSDIYEKKIIIKCDKNAKMSKNKTFWRFVHIPNVLRFL